MAAVCSGSLALYDAGVPLKEHVGALSVGLVMDEPLSDADSSSASGGEEVPRYKIMTDLMGLEDVLGDMDFKIAGTRSGITAIQLDCKPKGIPLEILIEAMNKLKVILERENRYELAQKCFEAVSVHADLDIQKFSNIFEH